MFLLTVLSLLHCAKGNFYILEWSVYLSFEEKSFGITNRREKIWVHLFRRQNLSSPNANRGDSTVHNLGKDRTNVPGLLFNLETNKFERFRKFKAQNFLSDSVLTICCIRLRFKKYLWKYAGTYSSM